MPNIWTGCSKLRPSLAGATSNSSRWKKNYETKYEFYNLLQCEYEEQCKDACFFFWSSYQQINVLTPFFDTCQGMWFLWREGGRFGRNQKMHRVGIGRWDSVRWARRIFCEDANLSALVLGRWRVADEVKEGEEDPDSTRILMIRL